MRPFRLAADHVRRFAASRRGNVAMIFAIALLPLAVAAGAGIDYARAVLVRSSLSEALDAAALAVGASPGLSQSQMQTLAQQYFDANYRENASYGTPAPLSVALSGQSVAVTTHVYMPTTMIRVIGIETMSIGASSRVVWGQLKIWVALALDNTTSMYESDADGSKISALKAASHQLLTLLQNASSVAGDVRVSIVPFARDVNIGTDYAGSDWLSFSDFTDAPPKPAQSVGPNSNCPWTDGAQGYHCQSGPGNGSPAVAKIPNGGAYKGYICPSVNVHGHYWNGCFDSVSIGGGKYKHTWLPNNTDTWSGCVTDRGTATGPANQDYDVRNAAPNPGAAAMVAENTPYCPPATVLPLGYDWTSLNNKINAMVPNGSTNQTIGLMWGWHSLTQGSPLNPPAPPEGTNRVIILLSDGLNTQDRWYGESYGQHEPDVDARMALACQNAKAEGITVYAVFVHINGASGNSQVLQDCASGASKYFDLTSSSQIVSAFAAIGQQITNLRVSQ